MADMLRHASPVPRVLGDSGGRRTRAEPVRQEHALDDHPLVIDDKRFSQLLFEARRD